MRGRTGRAFGVVLGALVVLSPAVFAASPSAAELGAAVRIVSPTSDEPSVAEAGMPVQVAFDASRPLPYAAAFRASGGDTWREFPDEPASGQAVRGMNTIDVAVRETLAPGAYDVRVQLIARGGGGPDVIFAADVASDALQVVTSVDRPTTGFEDRGGEPYTTLQEETEFLEAVEALSDRVTMTEIGTSIQGRPLRLARVGYPQPPSDEEIAAGRSVLFVGSQHGDERAGREAAMQLIRDLAFTDDPELIDQLGDVTVLVIPTANPDGFVLDQRANAGSVDLNRDHIRMAAPEGDAMAQVLSRFAPDITMDGHEGPSRPHNPGQTPLMELMWPRNLNVHDPLRELNQDLVEDYLFPALQDAGYDTDVYANPAVGLDGEPRMLHNAAGERHSLGVLFEPMRATAPERVEMTLFTVWEILRFHRERLDDILQVRADAPVHKASEGAAAVEPFYVGGSDWQPPPDDQILDPPPCGYLLNDEQFDEVSRAVELLGVEAEQVSERGVFVSMGQPMMTVVPLLLDDRYLFHAVKGVPLYDCADPGSIEPPYKRAAAADAHVRAGQHADTNFGSAARLEVKLDTRADWVSLNREAFLGFDISDIDPQSTVTLRLPVVSRGSAADELALYGGVDPWDESEITWTNADHDGGELIDTVSVGGSGAGAWVEFDVTDHVRAQIDAGRVDFRLESITDSDVGQIFFHSREADGPRPELDVRVDLSSVGSG